MPIYALSWICRAVSLIDEINQVIVHPNIIGMWNTIASQHRNYLNTTTTSVLQVYIIYAQMPSQVVVF